MATSTWRQIGAVLEHVETAAIEDMYRAGMERRDRRLRVLDIACGWGRYGALIRDSWPWAHITGVDARPERLRWRDAYDRVLHCELPCLPSCGPFEMVLMLDVIEHLTPTLGAQALAAARLQGPVILATPNGFMEQDGEKFDRHLCGWTEQQLRDLGAHHIEIVPSRTTPPAANGPGQLVAVFHREA